MSSEYIPKGRWFGRPPAVVLVAFLFCAPGAARAQSKPQLSQRDRIRLAEAFRLGGELQERVWKGWSAAPFAVLLVTPDAEFLIRHPEPTDDFTPLGFDPLLGSNVYYRKRTFAPNLLATFPAVSGISTIVVGTAEATNAKTSTSWVVTLLHEHFHQWQDSQPDFYPEVNALDLARGDQSGMWMLNFPFPYDDENVGRRFSALAAALADALRARDTSEFPAKLAAYRVARKDFMRHLEPDDYKYFSFQLWKEGVARYTEYHIARLAAEQFRPSKEFAALEDDSSFSEHADALLKRIFDRLSDARLAEDQRTTFYPVGAAEALLLDRANPDWHATYLREKFFLEKYYPD